MTELRGQGATELEDRVWRAMAIAPSIGLAAGELAILVGEYGDALDRALDALVARRDAFTTHRAGLTFFHPAGAVPLHYPADALAQLTRDIRPG